MSKLFRSVLIVAALIGAASSASATSYYGNGKYYGKHHNTLAFFDWLRKNGN
jgi:hypothetical protein